MEDWALRYVDAGYAVYPVGLSLDEDDKKVPDFPGNWRDSYTAETWRDGAVFGGAEGLAIDTGKSGIVVVDVDVSEGKSGLSNLSSAGIDLPPTPMRVRTWSGGYHGFYRQPGVPVGTGSNRPVKNVDFRGVGGVVFAAPTRVYKDGRSVGSYELIGDLVRVADLPVMPESYACRLRAPEKAVDRLSGLSGVLLSTTARDDQRDVLEGYLEDDLHTIASAGNGERNEALGRTVLLVADRCAKLGYGPKDFAQMVLRAYRESGGTDDDQALTHCRTAWPKVQADPLSMPKTWIDELADKRYASMVADRLARARINGASVRLVDESSFVDWTATPPDPEFWVGGVLPKGEPVVLYGRPEAGKTFTALDWAMSVASGRSWFGRKTEPGVVWFMAGEGNTRITARMHAWMDHHKTKPSTDRMRLINHVPDLMSDQVMEGLARKVAQEKVDLVFIDTLGRAMAVGGGDISSPPDANQALKSLQSISRYRLSTTPVAIHHPIKEGSMAGAYNLMGGLDVALHAEAQGDTGSLRFEKNKDGEKTTVCRYRWVSVGKSAVLVPALDTVYDHPESESFPYDREDYDPLRYDEENHY